MQNITALKENLDFQIHHVDETGSTNEDLKLFARKHEVRAPYALVTQRQFAGKGTRGRKWEAQQGALLFSVIFPWKNVTLDASLVPLAVGMSICDVLRALRCSVSLKWPNDIWFQHGKSGGILCEISKDVSNNKVVIVGIGINKNNSDFKTTNGWPVTGLGDYLNIESDAIINPFIDSLSELLKSKNDKIVKKWPLYDHFLGCKLSFKAEDNKESIAGVDLGINELGQLILQVDQKVMTFYSGTILYDDTIN